jgi:hypothetical protein
MNLLIWILVSFGITISITHGKLFKNFRKKAWDVHTLLGELFGCPMCLGFWVGILLNLTWQSVTGNVFLDGFLSLTTCFSFYCILWAIALKDV